MLICMAISILVNTAPLNLYPDFLAIRCRSTGSRKLGAQETNLSENGLAADLKGWANLLSCALRLNGPNIEESR